MLLGPPSISFPRTATALLQPPGDDLLALEVARVEEEAQQLEHLVSACVPLAGLTATVGPTQYAMDFFVWNNELPSPGLLVSSAAGGGGLLTWFPLVHSIAKDLVILPDVVLERGRPAAALTSLRTQRVLDLGVIIDTFAELLLGLAVLAYCSGIHAFQEQLHSVLWAGVAGVLVCTQSGLHDICEVGAEPGHGDGVDFDVDLLDRGASKFVTHLRYVV